MIKCPMCGHQFNEEDSRACCNGCMFRKHCNMIRCPNCNYDMPQQSRLLAALKKLRRK